MIEYYFAYFGTVLNATKCQSYSATVWLCDRTISFKFNSSHIERILYVFVFSSSSGICRMHLFFVFMLTLWLLLFFCLFVCFLSLSALISFVFLLCCIFFFLLFLDRFSCSDWASFTEETCTVGRDGLWSSEISTVFILSGQRSARTNNDQSLEHKREKFCTWCYCVLGGNC